MTTVGDGLALTNRIPVVADDASRAFFEAARRGEFLLHRTPEGAVVAPQEAAALTGLSPFAASGRGTVITSSVVYGRDEGNQAVPRYTIGVVELEEGPWWWSELVVPSDQANTAVLTGRAVEVRFIPSGPEPEHEPVPVFVVTD